MQYEMTVPVCLVNFAIAYAAIILYVFLMNAITAIFPPKKDDESTWRKAVESAYAEAYPGSKITKIQAK